MSLLSIPQTLRGAQRLAHIAQVLTKHGFGHVVERVNLRRYVPLPALFGRRAPESEAVDPMISVGNRLVRVCEELGPTFVKLGQLASSRPDFVPMQVAAALARLQDRVEPFGVEQARGIISSSLGAPIEELFATFDAQPLACGSIAQVHRATTPDHQDVVVKVRRPGIDATIALDMHVLRWLAELIESYMPELAVYHPRMIVDEFAQTMTRELDFIYEASTTHRFSQAFADEAAIRIPRVYWELTASNVLTLQRLDGTPGRQVAAGGPAVAEFDRRALAKHLAECFLRQYFQVGLFHADPHPGNMLMSPPDVIGLIDFGMVGQVSDELRGQLVIALVAAIRREVDIVIDVLADLAAIGPDTDRPALQRELRELLEKYYGQPLRRLQLGTIFNEITDLMRRYHVTLPRDFVMLGKSLVAVAGVCLQLDPELNLLELIQPHLRRLISERLSPARLARGLLMGTWHIASVLGELPRQLRDVMRRAGRGQFQVNIRHENLSHLASEIDRSSNRLAFSIFLAATIIGSALLIHAPIDQKMLGLTFRDFGFVGFVISFFMGLGLLVAILRSGKLS